MPITLQQIEEDNTFLSRLLLSLRPVFYCFSFVSSFRFQFQVNNVSVLSTFVKYLSKEICLSLSLSYSRYIVSDRARQMPILSTETVESKSTEVKGEKSVDLKDVKDGERGERERERERERDERSI